jgi:hypothetical protein
LIVKEQQQQANDDKIDLACVVYESVAAH